MSTSKNTIVVNQMKWFNGTNKFSRIVAALVCYKMIVELCSGFAVDVTGIVNEYSQKIVSIKSTTFSISGFLNFSV